MANRYNKTEADFAYERYNKMSTDFPAAQDIPLEDMEPLEGETRQSLSEDPPGADPARAEAAGSRWSAGGGGNEPAGYSGLAVSDLDEELRLDPRLAYDVGLDGAAGAPDGSGARDRSEPAAGTERGGTYAGDTYAADTYAADTYDTSKYAAGTYAGDAADGIDPASGVVGGPAPGRDDLLMSDAMTAAGAAGLTGGAADYAAGTGSIDYADDPAGAETEAEDPLPDVPDADELQPNSPVDPASPPEDEPHGTDLLNGSTGDEDL